MRESSKRITWFTFIFVLLSCVVCLSYPVLPNSLIVTRGYSKYSISISAFWVVYFTGVFFILFAFIVVRRWDEETKRKLTVQKERKVS